MVSLAANPHCSDLCRRQPGTPMYATDFDVAGVKQALAKATRERRPEWRPTPVSPDAYEAAA